MDVVKLYQRRDPLENFGNQNWGGGGGHATEKIINYKFFQCLGPWLLFSQQMDRIHENFQFIYVFWQLLSIYFENFKKTWNFKLGK